MIAVIDYGMGNLRSVQKALEKSGGQAVITQDPDVVARAGKVVLPGVGAMGPAMTRLTDLGLVPAITAAVASGKPFLGICLGLQLLFDHSEEGGRVNGLGLLPGTVRRFTSLKVPHMGWNQLVLRRPDCPLWAGIPDEAEVYFCHSYYVEPQEDAVTAAVTPYGLDFTSAVWRGRLYAIQFHPEKSQAVGLKILENFVRLTE